MANLQSKNLVISAKLHAKLRALAKREGMLMHALVERCLEYALATNGWNERKAEK